MTEKVVPAIPGLFDDAHSAPDGILLSHAHLDHAGLLHLSRASVPIFATRGTSKMMLAAAVFAGQKDLDRSRFREVKNREAIQIGDCQVTPLAVDHSIYGSVAFLIEAQGKAILYSGDFRNHGRKPGMIRDLLDHLKTKTIDVLSSISRTVVSSGSADGRGCPVRYFLELTERANSND